MFETGKEQSTMKVDCL